MKFFFYNFFFFGENFFSRIFYGEHFSFHKKISAKIFFTIFLRISFVFDVCEIMYFAKFFIRNFAYCKFFCFAILVFGKKNCKFFLRPFFQWWTWIPNFKIFLFWKTVKFSLIVLLDFFTHYEENNSASRRTAHKENPKQHEKYHWIFGIKNYLYA